MKEIAVVTTSRADYGIYKPVLRELEANPDFELLLYVTGMHLSPEFGLTEQKIREDGFNVAEQIESLLSSDTPAGTAKSVGLGVLGFAEVFSRSPPDLLIILGDRFEMFAAAAAAVPFGIPIAHIHGGELTVGAIDEAFRHSLTKMSHLHFVATKEYRYRVIQLGEEPWRVHVTGAPSLDNIKNLAIAPREELEAMLEIEFDEGPAIVTFHPVTRDEGKDRDYARELIAALEGLSKPIVITYPNADAGGRAICTEFREFAEKHENVRMVDSLGSRAYFGLMRLASVMVGNSSSGIIEAASFGLPVVDVGDRQGGRTRGLNVVSVGHSRKEIKQAIDHCLSPRFQAAASDVENPYGEGDAASRIMEVLLDLPGRKKLLLKRFHDLPLADPGAEPGK